MTTRALSRWLGASALSVALAFGCATRGPSEGLDPVKKALAHYDLGAHHMSQGRLAMAIRELRAAKELSPEDPWIRMALAAAYRRRGKGAEAEAELRLALELDPELHQARLNLSALYLQLKRYEEAIPHLERLADDATFPAPWRALTNLGWAQFRLDRRADALRSLELAVDYRSDYWPALLNLGILKQEGGRTLEAMRLFERVLEESKRPNALAEANYRMAEIYVSLGQRDRALDRLYAATEAAPSAGLWRRRSEEYLELLR